MGQRTTGVAYSLARTTIGCACQVSGPSARRGAVLYCKARVFHNRFLVGLMLGLLPCGGSPPAVAQQPLQYLGFQVSIGEGDPRSPLGNSQGVWTRTAASGAIGSIPLNRPPRRELLADVA